MTIHKTAAISAALLLLAGCSGTSEPAPTVTTTVTVTATPEAPAPTQEPVAQQAGTLAMGDTIELGGVAAFTVLEHATSEFAGDPNQGLLVQACELGEGSQYSTNAWLAVGESGGRYQASGIVGDPTYTPSYPAAYDEAAGTLMPGECLQGWMTFSTGEPLLELRYSSSIGDAVWGLA